MILSSSSIAWRKSSYSGGTEGTCVEVGAHDQMIAARDSKDPDGGVLLFSPISWLAFVTEIKRDRFSQY